jgi:hypothetical protein
MSDETLKGQLASEFIALLTNVSSADEQFNRFRQWKRIVLLGASKSPV